MIAHLSYVMCDCCGNPAEPRDNAKEARASARREGFVRFGAGRTAEDLCRQCAEKVAAQLVPEDDQEPRDVA